MLVLSRRKDESIVINDSVAVWVIDIRGDKVRLGIEAPRETSVHRGEVAAAIAAESRLREPEPRIPSLPETPPPPPEPPFG